MVPTNTSGAVWGSVSCPHADQGNQPSDLPLPLSHSCPLLLSFFTSWAHKVLIITCKSHANVRALDITEEKYSWPCGSFLLVGMMIDLVVCILGTTGGFCRTALPEHTFFLCPLALKPPGVCGVRRKHSLKHPSTSTLSWTLPLIPAQRLMLFF